MTPGDCTWSPAILAVYQRTTKHCAISDSPRFADDAILYLKLKSIDSPLILQHNLDQLYQWSKEWQMEFNVTVNIGNYYRV